MSNSRIVITGFCLVFLFLLTQTIEAQNGIIISQKVVKIAPQKEVVTSSNQNVDESRVGINNGEEIKLTIKDAIRMALEKNPDIEIQRLNVQQTKSELTRALGAYDLNFASQIFYETKAAPIASLIGGAGTSGAVTTDTFSSALNLNRLFKSGGKLAIDFSSSRVDTDNIFSGINPALNSSLGFTFTQPFARNYKLDSSHRQLLLVQKKLGIVDSQLKQRIIEIVHDVQNAYWDVVFAKRDIEIKKEAVDLARKQLEQNKRFVEAGTLAPVEIVSVEAQLEASQEGVLISTEQLTKYENTLKKLVLENRFSPIWNSSFLPVDTANVTQFNITLDQALASALKNRPELEQYHLQKEQNDIDVTYFKNQTRPQVDFIASYSLAGLSGTPLSITSPFSGAFNAAILDRVNVLSSKLNLGPVFIPPAGTIPGFFSGGYGQSLENLISKNFRDFRVGLSIGLPFQNRVAKADLSKAKQQEKIIEIQRAKQESLIEAEVRNSLQSLQTAEKRIQSARASRIASEAQLASEVRRYEAGESTNFFVLERQKSLSDARGRELKALTDYNKALVDLQRAMSTTLEVNNLKIDTQ